MRERTAGAQVVGPGGLPWEEPPSCILRVSGLAPSTDEEALRFLFVPHAPGALVGWGQGGRMGGTAVRAPQRRACVWAGLEGRMRLVPLFLTYVQLAASLVAQHAS